VDESDNDSEVDLSDDEVSEEQQDEEPQEIEAPVVSVSNAKFCKYSIWTIWSPDLMFKDFNLLT